MLQPLLAALLIGATPIPVRWVTGASVWSTSPRAVTTFLATGVVTDRGLEGALLRSGWGAEELRVALAKVYEVKLEAVSRFLYSEAGGQFLLRATTSYVPDHGLRTKALEALRAAIIADARDGKLSAAGIMAQLPTDFRLAETGDGFNGSQPLCAPYACQPGTPSCTSLLSWYAFLPACLQARVSRLP